MATLTGAYRGAYSGPTAAYTEAAGMQQQRYENALQRYLQRYQDMVSGLARAEEPLAEAKGIYAPGGEFATGALSALQEEAKKARAGGYSQLVASGMASGTTLGGLQARVAKDVAQGRREIEDVRTQNLTGVLSNLANLRLASAQAVGQPGGAEPGYQGFAESAYGPYMGYRASAYGADAGLRRAAMNTGEDRANTFFSQPTQTQTPIARLHRLG